MKISHQTFSAERALYGAEDVCVQNCTFDGPFRIGRDGATFIGCTFTNLGNDYVWAYGNDGMDMGKVIGVL